MIIITIVKKKKVDRKKKHEVKTPIKNENC